MEIGTISNWNEEKGFGFITPKAGGKDIFLHINDYSRLHKRPIKGLSVSYILNRDAKGRICATEVFPLRGHKNNGREIRQKVFAVLLFLSFGFVMYFLHSYDYIPPVIVGIYAVLSILALFMYAQDKKAAQGGHGESRKKPCTS